jgi:hypothetical protein
VKLVALMVAGFIASLKVAVMTEAGHIPTARFGGATEITVGAPHAVVPVVNDQTKLFAKELPSKSAAPVVMVAVNRVFRARAVDGVKVAVEAAYVTTPSTGVVPGPVNVNVEPLMVAGFIASLKVAVATVLEQTPVVAVGGVSEITVGGTQAVAAVVNVHTSFAARALPNMSFTPVVIVAV